MGSFRLTIILQHSKGWIIISPPDIRNTGKHKILVYELKMRKIMSHYISKILKAYTAILPNRAILNR